MINFIGYIFLIGVVLALVIPDIKDTSTNASTVATQKEDIKPKISKKLQIEINKKEAKILQEVRKEKKVVAAMWDKNRDTFPVLSVAVLNNQGNRDMAMHNTYVL